MIKQIKPNSLSHKFLGLIFYKSEIRNGINICDVPWRLLRNTSAIIAASMAIVGMLFIFICMLSVIPAIWVIPSWWPYSFVEIGWGMWIAMFVGIFTYFVTEVYDTLFPPKGKPIKPSKYKEQEPSPPSLIPLWWKSFKEKTCVKIVVADNLEEK